MAKIPVPQYDLKVFRAAIKMVRTERKESDDKAKYE